MGTRPWTKPGKREQRRRKGRGYRRQVKALALEVEALRRERNEVLDQLRIERLERALDHDELRRLRVQLQRLQAECDRLSLRREVADDCA